MLFPNIFGGYDTRDLPSLKVSDVQGGETAVMNDIRKWADYINQIADLYIEVLAVSGTQASGTFGFGTGDGEMQPYTEYGNTEATFTQESTWGWGVPIRRWRDRQMYTEEYIATKSLDQINKDVIAATNRFLTTRTKTVIRALTGNVNYTFNDAQFPGSDKGPLIVKRLFNNDGESGQILVNNAIVQLGTLQSYVPSGSASLVVGQFTLNRTKLRERGYIGRVIHIISPTDADTVKAMAGFIQAPIENPYVNVENGPQVTTTTAVVTRPQSIGVFNNGGVSDGEVVVFPFWPASYVLSFDATQPKPVRIREHELAQFRGFRVVQDETRAAYGENPLRNKRWEYIAGAAVENRLNGVVSLATTGAYAPPAI
jgi:hypothetical protein